MRLISLTLTNFRNYSSRVLTFDQGITSIVGPNGSGKTNILEAIYLVASGWSWRTDATEEMIRFDEDVAHIVGSVETNNDSSSAFSQTLRHPSTDSGLALRRQQDRQREKPISDLSIQITLTHGLLHDKRVSKVRYKIDGVAKRKSDVVGLLTAVLFEPESLQIVIGDPRHRRTFLDETLSQTDLEYRNDLQIYEKSLRVRNRLLGAIQEGKARLEQLDYWERAMVKHGMRIQEARRECIQWLDAGLIEYRLEYDASIIDESRLEHYREREVAAGHTLVGPQRDDFIIAQIRKSKPQPRNIAAFGSRGEQRMAVLKLKLAEARWIEERAGGPPVLLLDDIYSELDDEHDQMVEELVRGRQTIITATEIPGNFVDAVGVIKLDL